MTDRTHITYKTAKALKEFCPGLPEPMGNCYWGRATDWDGSPVLTQKDNKHGIEWTPAYQLHDLLSPEFCKTLAKVDRRTWFVVSHILYNAYIEFRSTGLPAVEAELMKMMEGR